VEEGRTTIAPMVEEYRLVQRGVATVNNEGTGPAAGA
jgi:hypothetical protein